jgi:hypothetical protein
MLLRDRYKRRRANRIMWTAYQSLRPLPVHIIYFFLVSSVMTLEANLDPVPISELLYIDDRKSARHYLPTYVRSVKALLCGLYKVLVIARLARPPRQPIR